MAVPSSGSGAVVVRCRERAGSRESMVAGACGGCNGCGRSGHGKAAYPCTQSMPVTQGAEYVNKFGVSMHAEHAAGHDSLPYRHRAAADGLSEIAPLCEDGRSKKSLCPLWGHRQEKQAGEGGVFGGSPLASTAEMRPDGGRRPCPLRRRKLRASTAEMRPDGGRRPCPLAGKTPHGITGNEEGALKLSAVGDTGPTDIAGRMRGSLSSSKAGCPGRYALRGRPARWAKPMRAWVSLAAVKSA